MKAKESFEVRLKMSEMHSDILKSIKEANDKKEYIKVCWLCYACFESRVNRSLEKIISGCDKCERKNKRNIPIYVCFSSFFVYNECKRKR